MRDVPSSSGTLPYASLQPKPPRNPFVHFLLIILGTIVGFVGFLGQNEVETVLFALVAVDQAVPVEAGVAVKEGDKRAWHLPPV